VSSDAVVKKQRERLVRVEGEMAGALRVGKIHRQEKRRDMPSGFGR